MPVFDQAGAAELMKCRRDFLDDILKSIEPKARRVLDAGCGIGLFADHLHRSGYAVTAFDARTENIEEARRRFPEISFHVLNAEHGEVLTLGSFDVTVCFGLLYHLENPFAALRHLASATQSFIVIESLIAPSDQAVAVLRDETVGEDQGLNFVAFVPSEACIAKMLYRAGFSAVYRTQRFPDHAEFRETMGTERRRTVIVASKVPLQSPLLRPFPEPYQSDLWKKRGLWRDAGRTLRAKVRGMIPRRKRITLPFGAKWVVSDDVMSRHLIDGNSFELGERAFLQNFLKPGMVVVDAGAHHGLYTLLASLKVGPQGRVIAFEPSPREFESLRKHVDLNGCRNVTLVPSALGSHEGTSDFYMCQGRETGCNSLRPPNVQEPVEKITVPLTTIDAFFDRCALSSTDLVKMDVEGAELDVLKGAERFLQRFRPLVLCEMADVRTRPWNYESVDIYDHLSARGYRWFSFEGGSAVAPCPRKKEFHENVLAVPEEKRDLIRGRS